MKRKWDKKLAVLLAAALTMSLAACANSDDDDDEDEDEKPAATTVAEDDSEEETSSEETVSEEQTESSAEVPQELEEEDPPAEEEVKSPELEKAAEFDADGFNFYGDACIYKGDSDDNAEMYDYKGEKLLGGGVPFVAKIDNTDYFAYCKQEGDMVYEGIIDAEGNVILSADEHVGTFDGVNSRFVKAYIPEGVTESEDEAIYYVSANQFSFSPNDDDTLYKGTVKLYDLENKKFLENTAANFDPHYDIYGDIISFVDASDNNVYVSTDDQVLDMTDYTPVGEAFLTKYEDGKNLVCGHDKNAIFSTACNISALDGSSYYYSAKDFDLNLTGVMSAKGRMIIEPKYDSVYGICEGYFTYTKNDGTGILKADGTEVTPADYYTITKAAPGYFQCRTKDNVSSLVDKNGKVIFTESGDDVLYCLDTPYAKIGDDYCYLVYSTGELSLKLSSSGTYFGHNILYSYADKALYDLVTGEKLVDKLEKAYMAYGHLCVLNDGKVTVYNIK